MGGVGLAFHRIDDVGSALAAVIVLRPSPPRNAGAAAIPGLSRRQTEVARLVARGLATKEIAERLGISAHTARHHVERIFSRLRVRSRISLAAVVGSHERSLA